MRASALLGLGLLLLPLTACWPAPHAAPEGLVVVDATSARPFFHDFGERPYGERPAHTFRLENREGRAIVLRDLIPDCGCTLPRAAYVAQDGVRVEAPPRAGELDFAVPAGATLEVRVEIDTTRVERTNADKLAQVRLRCDSQATPYVTFELHLVVRRAFRAVPRDFVLTDVPQGAGKSGRIEITVDVPGDTARIQAVESVEGPFTAVLEERQAGGRALWVLAVTAEAGLPLGPQAGKAVLSTLASDGTRAGPFFEIPLRAQVVTDCVVNPRVLQLPGQPRPRLEAELVALAPGARVRVLAAHAEGCEAEKLAVECAPVDPDEHGRAARWKVVVAARADLPPKGCAGKLRFELDDPALRALEVPYSCSPR